MRGPSATAGHVASWTEPAAAQVAAVARAGYQGGADMATPSRTVPGFVNAHTHIYSALAPYGMPPPAVPPENFVQILERVWWRLDRALDERSLRISARLYAAESLLYGTTSLVDHQESPAF